MSTIFDMIKSGETTRLKVQKFLDEQSSNFPLEMKKMEKTPITIPMPISVWRSRHFLAQVFKEGDIIRISVNRSKIAKSGQRWEGGIKWDDLQRIKREIGYGDHTAVELYPPDEHVVDDANMRHLFILKNPPNFMWRNKEEGEQDQ